MSTDTEIKILDHGYLKLIETWGSDERLIESARMSTGKGFLGWGPKHTSECAAPDRAGMACFCGGIPGDEKLLRYLYENRHATPFEFAGLVVEVQAPIFVFREWLRHRTQSYNEMSARYTPLPDLNYVPSVERIEQGYAATSNKQAAGAAAPAQENYPHENAERFRAALQMEYTECERVYQAALASGIPKELARLIVPVGRYSRMRAATNLRNWLAFATLRSAPSAQWEIRQFSDAILTVLRSAFPRTVGLFDELRRGP